MISDDIFGIQTQLSWIVRYSQRLEYNRNGLNEYLAPEGDYFVRSVDPNGTLHGVLGQAKHGYFEASPNHDAVALRYMIA